MAENKDTVAAPLVSAVSPKLPDFWPHACDVWLAQCEAQFRVAKISASQTKFDLCIQKLDESTVLRIQDLLLHPPTDEPYEALKSRLSQGFAKSEYQKLAEFAALPALGDRRPSQLLDSILAALAGLEHKPDSCPHVRYAFLSRLPVTIRTALISCEDVTLRVLANKADVLWSTVGVPAQSTVNMCEDPSDAATIAATAAAAASRPNKSRKQSASNSRQQQPATTPSDGWCRIHRRWGWDARSCHLPCSWPAGNAPAGGRRN